MAERKIKYASSATISCAVASLATSSTFVAGFESETITNATNLYLDALVSAKVTVGTTPTANTQIRVYVWSVLNDTPTYMDVLDGTASAETFTSAGVANGILALGGVMDVDATTSDRAYFLKPFSVAQQFGGVMPQRWGLFVTHNTGVNLNSTSGNHEFSYQGITETIA